MEKFWSRFEGATVAQQKQNALDLCAFWICGLMNNFVYVVFLAAAVDILEGSGVPKGIVLVADSLPALLVKVAAPYFMHRIPYAWRITFCSLLSVLALQLNAWFEQVPIQMLGIVLSSLSCGFGEMNFLALTTYFPPNAVAGWSSGTGGAGVFGALLYLALSTWARLPYETSMLIISPIPLCMLGAYFFLMSKPHLNTGYTELPQPKRNSISPEDEGEETDGNEEIASLPYDDAINSSNEPPTLRSSRPRIFRVVPADLTFVDRLRLLRGLLLPHILPLFFVFWAEYTINQGICPVLLYDYEEGETPLRNLRDHYVYYQFLYQSGVLLSRSSVTWIRLRKTWFLATLQVLTLVVLLTEALYSYFPTVYITFLIIFWEGLVGGATYVNTYFNVNTESKPEFREFSMSATGLSDGFGVLLAGVCGLLMEPALCAFQVSRGRDLCELVH